MSVKQQLTQLVLEIVDEITDLVFEKLRDYHIVKRKDDYDNDIYYLSKD